MVLYFSEQTLKTFVFIDLKGHDTAWLQYTQGEGQYTSMAHKNFPFIIGYKTYEGSIFKFNSKTITMNK